MTSHPRFVAALNLSHRTAQLLVQGRYIVQAMTGNPSFPAAQPALPQAKAALDLLDVAEVGVVARAPGAVEIRNARRREAMVQLHQLRALVQQVADHAAADAPSLIQSAGMSLKKRTGRAPSRFEAKHGEVSGSVVLQGEVPGGPAAYQWQWSLDQKTWTDLPATLQARTVVHGLQPATTYAFRFRTVTKRGQRDWSDAVTLVVH